MERLRNLHKSEVQNLKEAVEKGAMNTATEYEKLVGHFNCIVVFSAPGDN